MSTYAYAVKVSKTAPSVWRWDCPACRGWETSSSIRRARRRVYRWAVQHAATCSDLHWANWGAHQLSKPSVFSFCKGDNVFGYTIVKKSYIKRLKEELELSYDSNEKLDKEATFQASDWDIDRNQPLWITLGNQIEAQEQIIAVLTGENEELKLQLKSNSQVSQGL